MLEKSGAKCYNAREICRQAFKTLQYMKNEAFGGPYGGDAKGKASGAGAHRHHHAFARCAARCEKAVVGVPFAHGAVRRGLVVHGKARVSPAVPRGGFVHGRHRQRGKRRVQLRVLLQHRHGFAARAHVSVHTRKRALNGWHQAGARHGFYYSFAFGERSGGFQPVHADRDGRECRKHVECPERRYGLLPGGRTLRAGRH